ncbi:MAG: sensor histidine kinase [Actinomycetota bacterium]|nr:sensor histidine kinase [Actinomycetota bacterium]
MESASPIAAPMPGGRLERALARVGIRDHVARLLAATPSLRLSWFGAAGVAVGFSAWAASSGSPMGTLFFLVVAPLVPVAGVAAAYGPWIDPMYEVTQAAPMSSFRLVLLRASAVLVVAAVVIGAAAVALPGADWTAAAWILPALGLTLASLALSTFMPTHWAAGAVTLVWFATMIVTEAVSTERFTAFRGPGQVAFFALAVGSSVLIAWRRERLELEGREGRQRLIDAAEGERRRIERNIHDGAQQQLVSISVKLGIAKTLVPKDPDKAVALLADLQTEAQDALDSLREMTRGTYPPVLADEGLVAAIEVKARRAPFDVSIEGSDIGRFPKEIETAVYYCCLEALQNASKYAQASRATVSLRCVGEEISFTVADNGDGFDTQTAKRGVGLRSMTERLEALGGALEVRSAPGSGTTVAGRIPAASLGREIQ